MIIPDARELQRLHAAVLSEADQIGGSARALAKAGYPVAQDEMERRERNLLKVGIVLETLAAHREALAAAVEQAVDRQWRRAR